MGADASKVKCLYLPAQSGKTRTMQDLIREYKELHERLGEGDVNIIISDNNIFLTKQTEVRMENDLGGILKGVFSWTSAQKESNISSGELVSRIVGDVIDTVVVCGHKVRLERVSDLLKELSKMNAKIMVPKKVNVWIDEADKTIKLWHNHAELMELECVAQVTLVSATVETITNKYGSINVLGSEKPYPDCYRCLKHADKVVVDSPLNAVDYVQHVLSIHPEIVQPGARCFIPGDTYKSSHAAILDLLHERGFVVVIINGDRKEIVIPGQPKIDLRPYLQWIEGQTPVEFNNVLAKLYAVHDWRRLPLAITGRNCVGRGVTFQCGAKACEHGGFHFTTGVVPFIQKKDEAYQTMARLFGNTGDYTNRPIIIYSTSAMFDKVGKVEDVVMNMARMITERPDYSGAALVTKRDFKSAAMYDSERDWTLQTAEFDSLEKSNDFMHSLGARGKKQKTLAKEGDFYTSSTTLTKGILNYTEVKKEMEGWSKLSNFDVKDKTGVYGRLYIAYKDVADPSSVVFICRVLSKN
jgi:hypothetical protein